MTAIADEVAQYGKFPIRRASEAILVFDTVGRIVDFNDRAIGILGLSQGDIEGATLDDFLHGSSDSGSYPSPEFLMGNEVCVLETEIRRCDGGVFPAEISVGPIALGDRHYHHAVLRDVTQRKRIQSQMDRLKRMYAFVSRAHRVMVGAVDRDTLFQEVCRVAVDVGRFRLCWVGMPEPLTGAVIPVAAAGLAAAYPYEIQVEYGDTALGRGPIGTAIREGRVSTVADFASNATTAPWRGSAARHGIGASICVPLRIKSDTRYVLSLYSAEAGSFSPDEISLAEQVGASISVALDRLAVEQEREELELRRLRTDQRLELVLEATNEGYWDWDLRTGECYTSARYRAVLGYDEGELGATIFTSVDKVHPDDISALEKLEASILTGDTDKASIEFRGRHRAGNYVWVQCRMQVVERDAAGAPLRIVGTRSDVSERKQLEAKFLQAQKMESVGRLVSGVVHDFNNHLTVINGYADLVQMSMEPNGPMAELLRGIRTSGERAAALTRQLLAFSRRETVQKKLLNVGHSILEMKDMLYSLVGDGAQLTLTASKDLPPVMADPTQIEQIVMNLAVNARDAAGEQGEILIAVDGVTLPENGARKEKPGTYVRLSVTDNGCGMTPEVLRDIFEPFFTTKDESRGTGLGLSTVYAIAKGCGGFIEVESEPGVGSKFEVYLPCAPAVVIRPEAEPAVVKNDRENVQPEETETTGEDHVGFVHARDDSTLRVSGILHIGNAPVLCEVLAAETGKASTLREIDFSGVQACDTAAAQVLCGLTMRLGLLPLSIRIVSSLSVDATMRTLGLTPVWDPEDRGLAQ